MKRLVWLAATALAGCSFNVAPGAFCETAQEIDTSKSGTLIAESTGEISVTYEQIEPCAPRVRTKVYAADVAASKRLSISAESTAGAFVWLVHGPASERCDISANYECSQSGVVVEPASQSQPVFVGVAAPPDSVYNLVWTLTEP